MIRIKLGITDLFVVIFNNHTTRDIHHPVLQPLRIRQIPALASPVHIQLIRKYPNRTGHDSVIIGIL